MKQYEYDGILIGSNEEKTESELGELVEFVRNLNHRRGQETLSFEVEFYDGEVTINY